MVVSGEERREKNNINNRDAREKYNNIFTLLLRFTIAMYTRDGHVAWNAILLFFNLHS